MIRSSSDADLATPNEAQESATETRGTTLNIENAATSWPPSSLTSGVLPANAKKVSFQRACYIPSPEQDDYGSQLKSRLAVQRLAPTASPKTRECALLLRTASSKSVILNAEKGGGISAQVSKTPQSDANEPYDTVVGFHPPKTVRTADRGSSDIQSETATTKAAECSSVPFASLSPNSNGHIHPPAAENNVQKASPQKPPVFKKPPDKQDARRYDTSTSSSASGFQGPPGFPGAQKSVQTPSFVLPMPFDEYVDIVLKRDKGQVEEKSDEKPAEAQFLDRSRIHLSSSANELQPERSESSFSDDQLSALGARFSEKDSSGGKLLRKGSSLPAGYSVSYDQELEYEREEAGIGRSSPRLKPDSALRKAPSSSSGLQSHQRPRLILHLDINKTIMIKDTAQAFGSESMVNVLLSECAWGRLLPGPCWIPVGRLATDKPANDPELMTYRSYLDTFYLPLQRGFGPEIDRANDDIKHRRQALKRCFTAPGEPGAMFRGVFDKLMEELQVTVSKQQAMRDCGLGDGKELVLLPSFFELLKHLKASGREFAIVFRTFGSDVMDVSKELNLFCEGRHPYHPGVLMNGQDGKTDLRLRTLNSYGCFYREGFGSEGTMLAFHPPEDALKKHIAQLEELQSGECYWSFRAIYDAMLERCLEGGNIALAFRDYYPWWKAHQERARTGKLLLVDRDDLTARQIFFDDNIGTGSPHIVDVRDVTTGEPVPFTESNGKYLVKVEPLNAILDRQYFIRAVHRCEENIESDRDWKGFRNSPLKNSKWDIARRKLLSIIRLGSGQN